MGTPWTAPYDFDIRKKPGTLNTPTGGVISRVHPDGFNVLFADGSVWLMSVSVPLPTLQNFFTIEGARKYDREACYGAMSLGNTRVLAHLAIVKKSGGRLESAIGGVLIRARPSTTDETEKQTPWKGSE